MVKTKEEIINELGPILKTLRKERGYSREQLAEKVGITPRHLTAIENERKRPRYETLYLIIYALGVSADRIVYPENSKDDDATEVKNLYSQCSDRDKKIIRDIIDSMLDNK